MLTRQHLLTSLSPMATAVLSGSALVMTHCTPLPYQVSGISTHRLPLKWTCMAYIRGGRDVEETTIAQHRSACQGNHPKHRHTESHTPNLHFNTTLTTHSKELT